MPSKIQCFGLLVRLAILLAAVSSLELETQAENAPDFLWAKQGVTTNSADTYRVAVDASGNVFVAGSFKGRLDLGSTNLVGRGYFFHGTFVATLDDIFVAKYDTNGALLWARSAGGDGADYALGMALDTTGNCYVTGSFQDVADLLVAELRVLVEHISAFESAITQDFARHPEKAFFPNCPERVPYWLPGSWRLSAPSVNNIQSPRNWWA